MTIIDRQTLVAEQIIRDYVRKRLTERLDSVDLMENKVRKVVRQLILEAETGTEEPSTYTGINVLADLLKNIIPIISDDYKMLTTSDEQRESFRNHIVHAVKNSLTPIEVSQDAENIPSEVDENILYVIDSNVLSEKVVVDLDGDAPRSEAEFIDIEKEEEPEEEDAFIELTDQNETGRNFAADTFKRVEKQIVDAYDMLADDEDRDLFYDYLITNLLLYFDKFEAELQNELPSISTPQYEKEKEVALGSSAPEMEEEAEEEEEELDLDLDF
jgi:hypothetical protein